MTNGPPRALRDVEKARWRQAQGHEAGFWRLPKIMDSQTNRVAERYEPLVARFNGKTGNGRPVHTLEVGSGPTCATRILSTPHKVFLDPLMRVYRPLCEPGITGLFVCSVGETLPFSGEHFDLVFSFNVLDHVFSPAKFVAEMIRVTRPGGRIILGVYTHPRLFAAVRNFIDRRLPVFGEVAHPYFISRHSLVRLMESQGLRVEDVVCVHAPARRPSLHRQDWVAVARRPE